MMPNTVYQFSCVDCGGKIEMTTEKPQTTKQLHQLLLDRDWLPMDINGQKAQCANCQKKADKQNG
jgi:hypothetical protein